MKKIIFTMYFIFIASVCAGEFSKINEQAAAIANEVYVFHQVTVVVWWRSNLDDAEEFLARFRGTVVTVTLENHLNGNDNFHRKISFEQTVFFTTKPEEFKYFLDKIHFVNPIRIIVVLINQNETNLSALTEIAWNKDVTDIIILSKDMGNEVKVSTYIPYDNSKCGNHTPVQLRTPPKTYFVSKFKNFHTCPIRITILDFRPFIKLTVINNSVTDLGGIHGDLYKLLFERLNSSMDLIAYTIYGEFAYSINGTRIGYFNDLLNNISDIIAPAHVMSAERYSVAQISHPLQPAYVMWCLPKRRVIYEWAKVLLPFLNLYTSLILGAFLTMCAMIKFTNKYALVKDESKKDVIFRLFGIFIGQDTKFVSPFWVTNCLYVCWVWFSLIVRVSYQGNLIDGLRETILEPRITTLNEAIDVVDRISGLPIYLMFYKNTPIEKKYQPIKFLDILPLLKEIAAGKRYMLAVDSIQLKFYRQNVQVLDERVINAQNCIHMRPRWAAAPQISRIVSHIVESGCFSKLYNDMDSEWLLLYGNTTNINKFHPLNFESLKSCFYGLIVLYVAIFFILLGEIYWSKRSKNKNK